LSVLKTVPNFPGSNGARTSLSDGSSDQLLVPYDSRNGIVDISIRKCPHCGRSYEPDQLEQMETIDQIDDFAEQQQRQRHHQQQQQQQREKDTGSAERTFINSEPFIDSNYFKLLGDSASNNDHVLPDSLFTQGYFNKFFKEIELLGRGARGSVYKVEHCLNGISLGHFALKKITIGDDSNWLLKVLREVTMLCKISFNNSNLVNYNHVWLEVSSINDFGPKIPCAFILQQYCSGGNLEEFILNLKNPTLSPTDLKTWRLNNKNGKLKGRLLNNDEILLIFSQIVSGVSELHKNHIIHRDLKPSNCLLSQAYFTNFINTKPDISKIPTILVSDFGESQIEGEKRNATGSTGTLEYTAPELLNFQKGKLAPQFNKKTDIYSIGMILYFICFAKLPYESTDFEILQNEIKSFNLDYLDADDRDDLLPDFKYLIKNLTSKSPEERMDTDEILNFLKKIGSIDHHIPHEDDEKVPFVRRLSLTDGVETRLTPFDKLIQEKKRIILIFINFITLKVLIQYQILGYISIFAIGFTLTQKIKHLYILTVSMVITSIILLIYNYLFIYFT